MRYTIGLMFAATATLLAAPAAAKTAKSNQEVAQGPAPSWATPSEPLALPATPSGLAFVRAQDTLVHLDANGKSTYVAQRIVLLQPQALQLGNIGIEWNPASGRPTVHAVRIHRGAETIDVLAATGFEVLRREDQLEQAMLSGTLTAVLKVPDLRVGDELEFAYSVPTGDPTLGRQNADLLMLAGTTLPGRYRLGVSWDPGAEPRIRATDDFSGPIARSANAVEVRIDNPPTLAAPKDAPPRYGWQRVIEISDFATWGDLSRRFAGLYADAGRLAPQSRLKAEVARIAVAEPDALARVQAALALVQQQVRYIYVGLNGGNLRPASADETWQRRYGDCKAKTALLLALLGELGIPAQAVLVRNEGPDDGFDARLPNPALFDHVLVRATIDGKRYWLDGTLPAVATASLEPDFPYHWVLPLGGDGGQSLERLAWSPATIPDTLNLYEIDATKGFAAPARITSTTIKRGPAALLEYFRVSALTDAQLLEAFRNELTGESGWESIESVSYRFDAPARAGVLKIVGLGPVDWDDDGGGRRSLSLPGGGFYPPPKRQRPAGQDQGAPFYDEPDFNCYATTVKLPADTKPEEWGHNSTFDTVIYGHLYYRAFERRGSSIRMVRGSRTEQPEIDKQQAERDNARLERFDNSRAWIYYTPGRQADVPRVSAGVPATYEGDWLKSSEACLPADMRS
jgi:transglutaminase-like putative cysteine protease